MIGGVREREGERIERWGSIGLGLELVEAAGPWEAGPVVRAPAGLSLPPYSTCFSIKTRQKKIKKRKRRYGRNLGTRTIFPDS